MNKIKTSSKVALGLSCIVLSIAFLYFSFGGQKAENKTLTEDNTQENETTTYDFNQQENQEIAPVYSDIEGPSPTIQISEDTRGKAQGNEVSKALPQGFGFVGNQNENTSNTQQESSVEPLQELPIDLETPTENTVVNEDGSTKEAKTQTSIETMDPREVGVSTNDGPDKDYEETVLTVQRTLTAVNPNGEKQLIRLKIPVMYKSKSLRLEGDTKVKAQEVLKKLKTKGEELAKIKTDLEATLVEWNQLVMTTTPYEVLLPESPTLPQNQSAGRLNRDDNPSMSAGKAISYEIINK